MKTKARDIVAGWPKMIPSAIISNCGLYRYQLNRVWSDARPLYFVMLNPSTADANDDDPTIRKCIGFAKHNDFGSISVYNLFAYRAADPNELIRKRAFVDVVGPLNNDYIAQTIPPGSAVVCAWGSFPTSQPSLTYRVNEVKKLLDSKHRYCVKRTLDRPWHPLYVKYGALEPFA